MKTKLFTLILSVTLSLAASVAQGAWYAKFDGVDGSSKHPDFPGWIELGSFNWGLSNAGTGAGAVRLLGFSCDALTSKASPKILEASGTGKTMSAAVLASRIDLGNNRVATVIYELKNVRITGYAMDSTTASGTGDARPTDQFTLNFEEIKVTYIGEDGTTTTGTARFAPAAR